MGLFMSNRFFIVTFLVIFSIYYCHSYKNFTNAIQYINKLSCNNKKFNQILNTKKYVKIIINRLARKYKNEKIDTVIAAALINTPASLEVLHDNIISNCSLKIKARHYLLTSYKHKKNSFADKLLTALLGHKIEKNKVIIPENIRCLSCSSKKELIKAIDFSRSISDSIINLRYLYDNDPDIKYLLDKEQFIDYIIKYLNKHFKKTHDLTIIIALLLDTKISHSWLKAYLKSENCHYIKAKKYLYRSILKHNTKIACRLFNDGVMLNLKIDKKFLTAYFFNTISKSNFNLLKLLLKNGLSINKKINKETALTWLLKNKFNNYKAVKFLIKNNIDINYINSSKKSALDYAIELNAPKIIRILAMYGANATAFQQNLIFNEAIRTRNSDLFNLFGGIVKNESLYLPNSIEYNDLKHPDSLNLL